MPLGKTKSLVERWERRESSSNDHSLQTGSCGDRMLKNDSPPVNSVCALKFESNCLNIFSFTLLWFCGIVVFLTCMCFPSLVRKNHNHFTETIAAMLDLIWFLYLLVNPFSPDCHMYL